jgi:hypothetical protein
LGTESEELQALHYLIFPYLIGDYHNSSRGSFWGWLGIDWMETIASGSNGWNELIVGENNGVTLQETLIERLVSQRYRRKDMNLSKSQELRKRRKDSDLS